MVTEILNFFSNFISWQEIEWTSVNTEVNLNLEI